MMLHIAWSPSETSRNHTEKKKMHFNLQVLKNSLTKIIMIDIKIFFFIIKKGKKVYFNEKI